MAGLHGGGAYPVWARDGRELFYASPDGALMDVSVQLTPGFSAGAPRVLIALRGFFVNPANRAFDISPDGTRFLMIERVGPAGGAGTGMVVTLNWTEELKRLAPARR